VYGAKLAMLMEGLAPLAALGWTLPRNPGGMHLLVSHGTGDYVRTVAAASSLELALLSSYRVARTSGDGLFLRFGALDAASLRAGTAELVATATQVKVSIPQKGKGQPIRARRAPASKAPPLR